MALAKVVTYASAKTTAAVFSSSMLLLLCCHVLVHLQRTPDSHQQIPNKLIDGLPKVFVQMQSSPYHQRMKWNGDAGHGKEQMGQVLTHGFA